MHLMEGGNSHSEIPHGSLQVISPNPPIKSTAYPESVIRMDTPLLEESLSLERKEKDLINKALMKYRNNRKKAAQELGISERTLYRKIKGYDLE